MNASPNHDSEPWLSPFEELLSHETVRFAGGHREAEIETPEPMFGSPEHDGTFWDGRQNYPDTCAIRCQEFILEQFTGREIDESQLVHQAIERGWYTPGAGTHPEDVGKLLELHGIAVNRYQNANIFHLANELAQGHKVIVGVDSGELWQGNSILEEAADALGFAAADHAVVVSGIDTSEPDNIRAIISDPGTGDAVARYPLEQFLDAWRDSDFFMVTTRDPAPPHLPEMAHFDYSAGLIQEIAGIDYDEFQSMVNTPEIWERTVHEFVTAHNPPNLVSDVDAERLPEEICPTHDTDVEQDFMTDTDLNDGPTEQTIDDVCDHDGTDWP